MSGQRAISWPAHWGLVLALLLLTTASAPANAGSLTQKEVQILAMTIGFLEPPPSGASIVATASYPTLTPIFRI